MTTFVKRLCTLFLTGAMALLIVTLVPAKANAQSGNGTRFCKELFNPNLNPSGRIFASQGAQMYCFGSQLNFASKRPQVLPSRSRIKNVDAADPSEDISPNGTQAYGQSETSIAAADQYVVEAWNDATGFFSPCPSPNSKEELTGFGFSNNGGASFTDLGGLPNNNCATSRFEGDASVEAFEFLGAHYFYITSIFANFTTGAGDIGLTACAVTGFGSAASLSCGQPIIVAVGRTPSSFLDKDFATIDPLRGKLYVSYTDFGFDLITKLSTNEIDLAACDLTFNPMVPVCREGISFHKEPRKRSDGGN